VNRAFFISLMLLLTFSLYSQNFEAYMERGKEAMVNQDFSQALEYFNEAEKLRPQSSEVKQYLNMVNKMLIIENLDSVEEADKFIEENNRLRETQQEEEPEVSDELQDDFIYQQEQKDKAKQQRTPLFIRFAIPVAVPDSQSSDVSEVDNTLFFSNGYALEFALYPRIIRSVIGLGFEVDKGLIQYDQLGGDRTNILGNIYFRNFIIEEVGARLIFGSKVGAGFTMISGIGKDYQAIPAWHLSLFLSDPVFYHLLGIDKAKPLIVSGNVAVLYGEELNIIDGNLALTYGFPRFDMGINYYTAYLFEYQDVSIQPWSVSVLFGLNL